MRFKCLSGDKPFESNRVVMKYLLFVENKRNPNNDQGQDVAQLYIAD